MIAFVSDFQTEQSVQNTMSDTDDVSAYLQQLRLTVDAAQMKLLFVLRLKELQSVEFSFVDKAAQAV